MNIIYRGVDIASGAYTGIMVEYGTTATEYEPYTGGKPSPCVEYPQEIVNASEFNSDTRKYEVDMKVTGKNLWNPQSKDYVQGVYRGWHIDTKDNYITISIKDKGNNADITGVYLGITGNGINAAEGVEWIINNGEINKTTLTKNKKYITIHQANDEVLRKILNRFDVCVESGKVTSEYEPYKEQTLTITSDRPITKWDKLVEQDGQIGWLYATKYIEDLAEIIRDNTPIYGTENKYFSVLFKNENFDYDMKKVFSETGHSKVNKELYTIDVEKNTFLINISADDTIQTAKEHLHYSVIYNTTQTEFVPLPQEQQDAIRALSTYYPTTVVTNSEDMEMELSYVADTKNFILGIAENFAKKQLETNKLILERTI